MGSRVKPLIEGVKRTLRVVKSSSLKVVHHSKRVSIAAVYHARKVPKTRTYQKTKTVSKKAYAAAHHHVAQKPHDYLMVKSSHYARWHGWKWHKTVHVITAFLFLGVIVGAQIRVNASNSSFAWTFETPEDYSFDNTKVEPDSDNLRLSLRDKIENFTLAGGKLQSNNVLDVAADDDYYYVSNDLGIDVIRQDTFERKGYIASGGGFPTIIVENGYLYAGKNGGIYRWDIENIDGSTALGSYRYTTSTTPALGNANVTDMDSEVIDNKTYIAVANHNHVVLIKDDLGTNTIVKSSVTILGFIRGVAITSDGTMYYGIRANGSTPIEPIMVKYNAPAIVADWSYNAADVDFGYNRVGSPTAHGPDPSSGTYTGLRVSEGTSTANAGDNTLFIETQEGLSVIQENRTTPASGTVTNYTSASRGNNLLTGSGVQGRFLPSTHVASRSIDGDTGTYYFAFAQNGADWLEYNLGAPTPANYFRQFIWESGNFIPPSYVVESSTTGTSPNLSTSATAIGQWPSSGTYIPARGIDDNFATDYISNLSTSLVETQLFEVRYNSPQEVGAVDMHFRELAARGRDYVIEGSSVSTSDPVAPVSATASSGVAANAFDGNSGSKWESSTNPSVGSPQWINYDFGSATDITGLHFYTTDTLAQAAKAYSVQYSDDGTNWDTAYTENNQTGRYVRINFDPIEARYIRLNFTETQLGSRIAIHESQFYSSMFERGTVEQLASVTGNTLLSRLTTFDQATVKSIRIRATAVGDSVGPLGVKDMRTHTTSFESGTVTTLSSMTNVGLESFTSYRVNHDVAFPTTSIQHLRLRQPTTGASGMLIGEVRLHNTSLPEWFPSIIKAGAVNTETGNYYAALNSNSPEEGRIVRVDGAQTNQLSIGEVITTDTKEDLPSNEFTSIAIQDNNRSVVGTSNAGASFIGKRYATDLPTIQPESSYDPPAVASWKTFEEDVDKNGGEVYYQISNDGGDTFYFWDGDSWEEAGADDFNIALDINENITDFPVGEREFTWKAFLDSNGSQQITLSNITVTINPDITPPTANADNIQMFNAQNAQEITEDDWATTGSPFFLWDVGEDDQNPGATGIKGYCIYLGQDENANPETDKGILGTSPLETDGNCAFTVASPELDLSASGMLASELTSSTDPYYIRIKALDQSNNVFTGSAEQFSFRFDDTPPAALGFISAPSQFIATRDVTLTWPTSGDGAVSDAHSGVLGLQYRIGGEGTWYGAGHTGTQDRTDVLENNGSYRTDETHDYPELIEGNNIIYFRTIDQAGNFSSTNATAVIKVNTSAPSSPQNVTASPSTNTANSFAFNWNPPSSFVGPSSALEYCYTVNTLPTSHTCNFTPAGSTNLAAGPYATQPGENTFYIVAKDEAGNINYDTYASTAFQANTAAPGMPTNIEVADISTKATSSWKIALSWAAPESQGAGVANYRIFRSSDNQNFTQIATTAGISYVDGGITQNRFYYKIRACDSANNCGAFSTVTNMYPTGKFTEPAELVAKPEVSNITTKRARIQWSTNRESDSKVAIGKARGNYFASEISNSSQVTNHVLELDNLDTGTTYYFVARWTDEDGNTGVSQEVSFTTAPAPFVKEVEVVKVGLSSAMIRFTSKDASSAVINYGQTESFGGITRLNTSQAESQYTVELGGLNDGSKYFFRVALLDNEGGEYAGDLYSFTTPARPRISNLQFQPVKDQPTSTQKVSWTTNVPASSQITYGIEGEPSRDAQDAKLKTQHELIIKDLKDDSQYFLVAESRDAGGNIATSERQLFETALDTRPPKISEITIEPSIKGTGAEARGQVVVSWKTDEPSTSQVAYAEGSDKTDFTNKTAEDGALSLQHIVIISDLPTSKIYTVQPISKDGSDNSGAGETRSAIIGRASDSVITIVLNTLRKVFGF